MKDRINNIKALEKIGEKIKLAGWVDNRRDHGKLIFFDLRDKSGLIQVVVNPQVSTEAHKIATSIRNEYVVSVVGLVNKRPEKLINKELLTGTIEIEATEIDIVNTAETPPFNISTDGYEIGEENRLKYRYLDLRRSRLQKNLKIRHQINLFIRNFLSEQDFIEIETPYISKSTPEGARDYVVPSRLHPGKFYALPQSPQQYKQLLMVSGLEKYFQIVRCFRDEDTRGDRQPEFTQLDIEQSFVNQEDILNLVEQLIISIVKKFFPEKTIPTSFPRLEYQEVMEKHETDRPDLRKNKKDPNELAFAFIVNFPMFEIKKDKSWGAVHHPFTLPTPDIAYNPETLFKKDSKEYNSLKEGLESKEKAIKLKAYQYDLVANGFEIGGGSIRNHDKDLLAKVFEILDHNQEEFQEKFGHLAEAFSFGAPPHGGIALGLDRLWTVLFNEPNIREVIAFPKTGDGRDLMMESPSEISKNQLEEIGLEIKTKKQK